LNRFTDSHVTRYRIVANLDGTVGTIRVEGEFDLSAVEDFREAADKLLGPADPEALVVDIRELEFMDSSGLSELIRLDNVARERGFRFAILKPPPAVAAIFQMTGLDQHLPLVSPETALEREPRRG
jgi:anti-anti-sigma factor